MPTGLAGSRWRRLQTRVYREERVCGICGQPVDQTLRWPHPDSRCVDHILDRRKHPELAYSRHNVQLAHKHCNEEKGAGPAPIERTPGRNRW